MRRGWAPAEGLPALSLRAVGPFADVVTWREHVRADPLPWLLEKEAPAARAATLQRLCDASYDAADVRTARDAAMRADPIKTILDHQDAAGWWVKPGTWLRNQVPVDGVVGGLP